MDKGYNRDSIIIIIIITITINGMSRSEGSCCVKK